MEKFAYTVILLCFLLGVCFPKLLVQANAEELERLDYYSKSIYVYNLTDQEEVFSLNADFPRKPASLVKIMTCLVALEHLSDLSALAPIAAETYYQAFEEGAAMAGFEPYEQTTYRDLLYGTMLPSGAEAANSLAMNIAGNQETFVQWMNLKAKSLGLKKTVYKSVDGMDHIGQTTTAKEVAKLLQAALENGHFKVIFTRADFVSSPTAIHPQGVYMESTVFAKLKDKIQEGFAILGGKSGTTYQAGLCWATLSQKAEKEYLVVVMGAEFEDLDNIFDGQVYDTLDILQALPN